MLGPFAYVPLQFAQDFKIEAGQFLPQLRRGHEHFNAARSAGIEGELCRSVGFQDKYPAGSETLNDLGMRCPAKGRWNVAPD